MLFRCESLTQAGIYYAALLGFAPSDPSNTTLPQALDLLVIATMRRESHLDTAGAHYRWLARPPHAQARHGNVIDSYGGWRLGGGRRVDEWRIPRRRDLQSLHLLPLLMNGTVDPLALPAVPPPAPASHPHRDRIVAVLFVLAVALPGLALVNTWSKTITTFENRAMAPWPAFARTRAFTHAFELAFADRFGARDTLVRLHRVAMLRVFGISGLATVLPGRDGWYYWLGEDGRSLDRHYRRTLEFPQASVDATVNELNRRAEWLAARGHPLCGDDCAGEVHNLSGVSADLGSRR